MCLIHFPPNLLFRKNCDNVYQLLAKLTRYGRCKLRFDFWRFTPLGRPPRLAGRGTIVCELWRRRTPEGRQNKGEKNHGVKNIHHPPPHRTSLKKGFLIERMTMMAVSGPRRGRKGIRICVLDLCCSFFFCLFICHRLFKRFNFFSPHCYFSPASALKELMNTPRARTKQLSNYTFPRL